MAINDDFKLKISSSGIKSRPLYGSLSNALGFFPGDAHPLDHAVRVAPDGVIIFHDHLYPAAAGNLEIAPQAGPDALSVEGFHRQVGRVGLHRENIAATEGSGVTDRQIEGTAL